MKCTLYNLAYDGEELIGYIKIRWLLRLSFSSIQVP